jgi:hypothetical protein
MIFDFVQIAFIRHNLSWLLYSSPVLGELTNETRAEGKLVCIMPCKEEEDEVKVHEVGWGFILADSNNNFKQSKKITLHAHCRVKQQYQRCAL